MASETELQTRLEAAERELLQKSELLAHTSHEIRTQLSGVIGMTQLALDTHLTPEQAEYLQIIDEAGQAVLTLVNDLLDVSKMDAGRLEIESIPFALRDGISDIVTSFSPALVERGLWLTAEFAADVPERVLGDPGRLRQVVSNLLSNAAKFTEKGGVSVNVTTPSPGIVSVAVVDTGVGVPPDRQAAIFDSYTQVDETTARTHGGTGLGLAISRRLAEIMGGGLTVASEAGVGSTFTATFAVTAIEGGQTLDPATATSEFVDLPILVAGEISNARREALNDVGFALTSCAPSEAEDRVVEAYTHGAPFALVVVAVGVDPLGQAAAIRERVESLSTHVLLVVNTGTRGDAALCRELQVAGYLANPFTPEDLAKAASEVLAGPAPLDLTRLVTKHWLRERRRRLNVLVVDDSPTIRLSTQRMLERRGHVVVTAASADDAELAAKARRFDAAVVDLEIPGSDGLVLVERLRHASESPLPVVASTIHPAAIDGAEALLAGCSRLLNRPFEIHALVAAIEESVLEV